MEVETLALTICLNSLESEVVWEIEGCEECKVKYEWPEDTNRLENKKAGGHIVDLWLPFFLCIYLYFRYCVQELEHEV